MSQLSEDRVYARHQRLRGAVLIIGAGAVGSSLAEHLADMGISPLWLVDKDVLEVENLVRNRLGHADLDRPKAVALAERIRWERPWCDAFGRHADFLQLSQAEQLRLVSQADVVVAATDVANCQRQINAICLRAEKPAVYPSVWVDQRIRDAEVGEILWVRPGHHTPCYECWTTFRQASADAQAARGAGIDIEQISLATAQVVAAVLAQADQGSGILDPAATAIYVHGLTPTSPSVRRAFPGSGLQSRNVRVPFPSTPCPACGSQESPPAPQTRPPQRQPAAVRTRQQPAPPTFSERPILPYYVRWLIYAAVAIGVLLLGVGLVGRFASEPTGGSQVGSYAKPPLQAEPDTGSDSVPLEDSGQVVPPPQGNDAQVPDESQSNGSSATEYFTIHEFTLWCQSLYEDASAAAEVVPEPPDPPAWWIKCVNSAGQSLGGLDLDWICNDAYSGSFAANPELEAAEAWNTWYCAAPSASL